MLAKRIMLVYNRKMLLKIKLMRMRLLHPEILASVLLFFAMFFLTLWRFGANQCLALLVVLVLLYRPWRKQFFCLKHFSRPIILFALLFLLWAILSLSYTEAPCIKTATHGLSLYGKLLFLLVLPIAMAERHCQKWVEQGLIWGVFINMILSSFYYFQWGFIIKHLGPYYSVNGVFSINPLQMIFVLVLACWMLLQRFINKEAHWSDVAIFVLLSLYLWLINIERSGYLLYLVLLVVALYQVMNKKGFVLACIAIPVLLIGLYEFSPNVKNRIDVGIANVQAFQQVQDVKEVAVDNSLGLRLAFFTESMTVIKMHPLLGTGIGSFKSVYTKMGGPSAAGLNDPHNAYTFAAFELGLIGLALYLCWLGAIFHVIKKLPLKQANVLRGLWWMFVVMGLTDTSLILNAVGLGFIVGVSLYARERLLK
jgi:O-antigen ligase